MPVGSQSWGSQGAAYLQVYSFDLNGSGRSITVAPGASLTARVSYQFWDNGNPSAIWQIWIIYASGNAVACIWSGVPGAQPGVSRTDVGGFSAPASLGTYTISLMPIALYSCSQLASIPRQSWPSSVAVGQVTVQQQPPPTPTCPDGQYWNGAQCVCPSGQQWNGQQCVTPPPPTPTCPDGQYWNGAQCVCPSGQQWNGQQCVTPPPPPTCPSMNDPSIINLSSGNVISVLSSYFIQIAVPATQLPLAQDKVTIRPVGQSPISRVEIGVTEDDSSNYADLSQVPPSAALQSDGSYVATVNVLDRDAKKPINVAWGIIEIAVSVGAQAGSIAAQIIDKALTGLGVLEAAQPPPDVRLSVRVVVHYANGLDCPYGGYSLPTFASGVRENWDPIVNWFVTHVGWILSLHSNADILAVDSSGRRVGALYENGNYLRDVNEIPGAAYSGHGTTPQIIALPSGDYRISVEGNAPGQYTLMASSASANWNVQSHSGATQSGSTDGYTLSGSSIEVAGGNQLNWSVVGLAAAVTIAAVVGSSEAILRRRRRR
jgi:hypothetical protein